MAKSNTIEPATDNDAPATAPAAAEADSRLIMINVPEGHAVTTLGNNPLKDDEPLALAAGSHPRNAVIRALAKTGEWERGAIAKEITNLQYTEEQRKAGKKVAYQIVFQATKGIPNVKKSDREASGSAQAGGESTGAEVATEAAE